MNRRAVIDQYKRLEFEKSAARSRAMLSIRGHRRNDKLPIRCSLCSRSGHSALQCREFQIIRREKKPNGYKRDAEYGGNGGGGGNDGGGGNSGGGDGNRGGRGSKTRSGVAVSKRKVAKIPNPAIRSLAPTAISVEDSTKPRNAQTAPSLQRRRPLPAPNMANVWVVSAQLLGLDYSSPQALARIRRTRRLVRAA